MLELRQLNKKGILKMTITPEALANKMVNLKKNLSNKVGLVDSSPVTGIDHSGLAVWYALQVGFDRATHDPNQFAKFLVVKYERDHRDAFFFKNGNQKKLRDLQELSKKIYIFIK